MIIGHDKEHISAENINTIRLPGEYRRRSSSIEVMDGALFSTDNIKDSTTISSSRKTDSISSPLMIVGNARKYSVTKTKAKDQQIAISTEQSFVHSKRNYGEVYTRQRVNFFIIAGYLKKILKLFLVGWYYFSRIKHR